MSDLHWCIICQKAINCHSDSLYCSDKCLKLDQVKGDIFENNNNNHHHICQCTTLLPTLYRRQPACIIKPINTNKLHT